MQCERPVILPNKILLLTLSWILNLQRSLLRNYWWRPCIITLLSTSGVLTPGLTVVQLGEKRCSDGRPPWSAYEGIAKRGKVKKQSEEVTGRTGVFTLYLQSCAVLRDTTRAANPSNKTPTEAKQEETDFAEGKYRDHKY